MTPVLELILYIFSSLHYLYFSKYSHKQNFEKFSVLMCGLLLLKHKASSQQGEYCHLEAFLKCYGGSFVCTIQRSIILNHNNMECKGQTDSHKF